MRSGHSRLASASTSARAGSRDSWLKSVSGSFRNSGTIRRAYSRAHSLQAERQRGGAPMREYREEELVRRAPTDEVVEERVAHTPFVEETVGAPAPPIETVRRRSWWRPAPPVVQRDVVSTEYYTTPTYGDPTLNQFIRMM